MHALPSKLFQKGQVQQPVIFSILKKIKIPGTFSISMPTFSKIKGSLLKTVVDFAEQMPYPIFE
jgi:hypothetical protein